MSAVMNNLVDQLSSARRDLTNEADRIAQQIAQIDNAIAAIGQVTVSVGRKTRNVSPEQRARLAQAMRERWAAAKAQGRYLTDSAKLAAAI